jgi:ubiquinone/menaquinone biosynthesis C-methylase UbiE
MKYFLRLFFRLLYHQFAFAYDLVAALVSFNHWKDWVRSVVPFIQGNRILEIGHGPGHLQRMLLDRNLIAVGLDQSAQMGRLARRNLTHRFNPRSQFTSAAHFLSRSAPYAYTKINLTRGMAQRLPFRSESFDTIVATFPTEYINQPQTLTEVKRCLLEDGRLIVLPVALPKNLFLDWLFRITHQSPTEALEVIKSKLEEPFASAGFHTEIETLDVNSGVLLIVLAKK